MLFRARFPCNLTEKCYCFLCSSCVFQWDFPISMPWIMSHAIFGATQASPVPMCMVGYTALSSSSYSIMTKRTRVQILALWNENVLLFSLFLSEFEFPCSVREDSSCQLDLCDIMTQERQGSNLGPLNDNVQCYLVIALQALDSFTIFYQSVTTLVYSA